MQSVKEFLHVGRGRCTLLFTEQPPVKKLIKYWKMIKYKIQQSARWSTGIALEYAKHGLAYSSAIWWRIRLFPDSLAMYLSTQKEPRAFLWSISIGSLSSGCFMSSQRLPCAGRWSSSLRGAGSYSFKGFCSHMKITLRSLCVDFLMFWVLPVLDWGSTQVAFLHPHPCNIHQSPQLPANLVCDVQ